MVGAVAWRAGVVVLLVVLAAVAWSRLRAVAVSAPWEPTVDLSRDRDAASTPQVGVDARGDAVAVWVATTRGAPIVQSASRAAGASWRRPVDVSSDSRVAGALQVAVGADGTAVAVWESDAIAYVGPRVVMSAVRERGEDWQAPVRLSGAVGAADAPGVAVDERGNATVVWTKHRGNSTTRVQSASRPSGGRWQPPVDLGEISVASHGGGADPQIAVDARGNAVAAWVDAEDDLFNQGVVQTAVRPVGRGWQPPVNMSPPKHRCWIAQVTFDARGNIVALWSDDTDRTVRSATRRPDGPWSDRVEVFDGNVGTGGLAVSATGKQILSWTIKDAKAVVASRTTTGRWRSRDSVDIYDDDGTYDLTIAVGDRGDAVAVWVGDGGLPVRAALMPAGEDWQRATQLGLDGAGGEASGAAVAAAIDARGNAIAVWGHPIRRRAQTVNVVQAATHGPP